MIDFDPLSFQSEVGKTVDTEKFLSIDYLPTQDEVMAAFPIEGEFYKFCRENKIYEFITKEYINSLANHLISSAEKIIQTEGKESITILEIGAGDGKLTHSLRKRLSEINPKLSVKFIATDNKDWEKRGDVKSSSEVEGLNHIAALKKYNPDIVISSWMLPGEDWTQQIRNTQSVMEYIMIGEPGAGCVGTSSAWGDDYYDEDYKLKEPKAVKDGFKIIDIYDEENFPVQFSLLDTYCPGKTSSGPTSKTASFVRNRD